MEPQSKKHVLLTAIRPANERATSHGRTSGTAHTNNNGAKNDGANNRTASGTAHVDGTSAIAPATPATPWIAHLAKLRGPLWLQMVTAAGEHCQCGGGHPKHHRGESCEYVGAEHLIVAPADPAVPPERAHRVPAAELAAWCPKCLDGMRAVARAAGRRRPVEVEPDLFSTADLFSDGPGDAA